MKQQLLWVALLMTSFSLLQEAKAQTYNTKYGSSALYFNTTGDNNSAFGNSALTYNTSGSENTAIGTSALHNSKTGSNNTALGRSALVFNTTGSYNTASGNRALFQNTTGFQNTALGFEALRANTTGNYNTASGTYALYANSTGTLNTASGYRALFSNKAGSYNTATGYRALYNNDSSSFNTAYGVDALRSNTKGYKNTAAGFASMDKNTTGYNNTAFGAYALQNNTDGSRNTALGDSAGAAFNNTYSTFVGYKSDVTANNLTNVTVIGHRASATASNQVRIGNTSVTSIGGKVGWTTLSDGRFKKNIVEDVPGLTFITKLRPVNYTLDIAALDRASGISEQGSAEEVGARAVAAKEKHTGFVAQEVEKAAAELKYDFGGVDKPKNERDLYGLRYAEFVVPLVKAVQELSKKDEEVDALKKEVTELKERLNKLEGLLTSNSNTTTGSLFSAHLKQSAPNPASTSALIRYQLPLNAAGTLVFTDAKGRTVKSMTLTQGSTQVTLNTSQLAVGAYTYTLHVSGQPMASKQLVVAR